jgi:GT2 family glycosyltransferase
MDPLVLFIGSPKLPSSYAVPNAFRTVTCTAEDALERAKATDVAQLLIVEQQAFVGAKTYEAAASLDTAGGMLGGCLTEPSGGRRFGSVFATVPFGPYEVEPFSLVDSGNTGQTPSADGVDVVAPGLYLVDKEAFIAVGGFCAGLGQPWRGYDLCLRFRAAGKPVRWDAQLAFSLELGVVSPEEAVDHRDFMRIWEKQLAAHFDLETPSRGGIRRTIRSPYGQRETVSVPLPPTEVILYGQGSIAQMQLRGATRVRRLSFRDARGDEAQAVRALDEALRTRSERYLVLVEAGSTKPEPGWLERMLVELESNPNLRGVREKGRAALAVSRLPLHVTPGSAATIADALDVLLEPARSPGTNVSVVYVAHARVNVHWTSFEGVYGSEPDVDYHVVATSSRPESVDALSKYSTLDLTVDDSRTMAGGINAALARAKGDIVVIIGDDFYPPQEWLPLIREAFTLRPDMGILGLSAVFVDGPQCIDLGYADMKVFKALVASRRIALARDARLTDRLAALALAVDRRALAVVGGFDERLGAGRWGIEDLTLRMRAAGYRAYVTEDLFLHRFPTTEGEPFLNEPEEEARRAAIFVQKWNLQTRNLENFDGAAAIARGFDSTRDFVALADSRAEARSLRDSYGAVFVGSCSDENELDAIAPHLRRYFSAFSARDETLFVIGVGGEELKLETVSARARAILRKTDRGFEDAPDVAILRSDVKEDWLESVPAGPRHRLDELDDISPSGLRRALV